MSRPHPSPTIHQLLDEVRMKDAYDDFDSAIIDFVRYQKAAWPFDPYEPRTNFPRVIG
jgi:hypothetical protein